MSKPLLSLLIPTVVGREQELKSLLAKIKTGPIIEAYPHCDIRIDFKNRPIEVVIAKDEKQMTIGGKRELLYNSANGLYSWQIDDDDSIAEDAISLILQAIKENPGVDCVTFRENCMRNGEYKSSNHSLVYEKWQDNFDGYDYVRCPFYKDVIRTEIAKSVPFPKIRYGEDEQWSMALRPHLKTEYHIDKELYYYFYSPKDTHEERYGFNRNA